MTIIILTKPPVEGLLGKAILELSLSYRVHILILRDSGRNYGTCCVISSDFRGLCKTDDMMLRGMEVHSLDKQKYKEA